MSKFTKLFSALGSAAILSSTLLSGVASAIEPCKTYVGIGANYSYAQKANFRGSINPESPDYTSGTFVPFEGVTTFRNPKGFNYKAFIGYAATNRMRVELQFGLNPSEKAKMGLPGVENYMSHIPSVLPGYNRAFTLKNKAYNLSVNLAYDFANASSVTPYVKVTGGWESSRGELLMNPAMIAQTQAGNLDTYTGTYQFADASSNVSATPTVLKMKRVNSFIYGAGFGVNVELGKGTATFLQVAYDINSTSKYKADNFGLVGTSIETAHAHVVKPSFRDFHSEASFKQQFGLSLIKAF